MSEDTVKKVGLFDFLNDITKGKNYLLDESSEKAYDSFIINKGLGQHLDTILLANETNKRPGLSKQMHHDYLFYSVDSRSRYGSWVKSDEFNAPVVDYLKEKYSIGQERAFEYMSLLGDEGVKQIEELLSKKGGKSK